MPKKGIDNLLWALKADQIPHETEYRFHPVRRWRFDIALPEHQIAVEYEGIFSRKSRHTTVTGYSKDCEKYNEAVKLGWRVLRYTQLNYTNCINDLKELINV